MKALKPIKLYDMVLKRVNRLDRISKQFEKHCDSLPIDLQIKISRDYAKAMDDNLTSVLETVSGIVPESHEIHFKRCLDREIGACTCSIKDDAVGQHMTSEIL